MNFIMTYQIRNESWDKAVSRFLETGGPTPEGLKLLGRWHAAAGPHGFLLLETEDVASIYRFAAEWHFTPSPSLPVLLFTKPIP